MKELSEPFESTDPTRVANVSPDGASNRPEGISLLRLLNGLLRHWRLFVIVPPACAVLALGVALLQPRTYSSTASFVTQNSQSAQSQLSGLAAQFGVSVGGGNADQSPEFYEAIIKTTAILGAVVDSIDTNARSQRGEGRSLADLLGVNADPQQRRARTIAKLREMITTRTDKETGIVQVTVRTPWAAVSKRVADHILDRVNTFNLLQRQRQAVAEQRFVQARLADAQSQLHVAETDLQSFLERNRQFALDPQLASEYERRQRTVAMRQQLYTSLAQMYEQASLTALRDTPLIAVVEQPALADDPDPRGIIARIAIAFIFGIVIAMAAASFRELVSREREEAPEAYHEYRRLRRRIMDDARRVISRRETRKHAE